jgi:hypothetical protein
MLMKKEDSAMSSLFLFGVRLEQLVRHSTAYVPEVFKLKDVLCTGTVGSISFFFVKRHGLQ